jgi:DNA-binding transcriptional MocR family regulator
LVALCETNRIPLIDDDTFGETQHDAQRPPFCLLYDASETVIHIGSFSKVIAPGVRVGFVISRRWRKSLLERKVTANIATSVHPQLAIARLIESGDFDRHRQRILPHFGNALLHNATLIQKHFPDQTRISQPRGGVVLWVELPRMVHIDRLYQDAIRAKVCVAPGTMFSASGHYHHHMRLTVCAIDPRIDGAIERLGALVHHSVQRSKNSS